MGITSSNEALKKHFSQGNILFLGCHLDDIEYGCGGLIHKLVELGFRDQIRYLTLTRFNKSADGKITIERDLNEVYTAISHLGLDQSNLQIGDLPGQLLQEYAQEIREILLEVRRQLNPAYVFYPSRNDIHQDHHTLCEEAVRIFRNTGCYGYELIRSCYHFQPNFYIEIDENNMANKIDSVMSYQSQQSQSAGYYFHPEVLRSICTFRGGQSGKRLAEAYEIDFYHL